MAKKKIVVSGVEEKKYTPIKKTNSDLIKKIIAAVIILAIVSFGVIKYIESTTNYIGTVDGKKIYVYEFEDALKSVINEMEQEEKGKLEDSTDWTDEKQEAFWSQVDDNGKSNRLKAKEKALALVVEQKVKLSEAAERDIYLDNRQKKEIIRNAEANIQYYMSQYGGAYTSENDFTTKVWGISFAQYKEQQGIGWIINKLDTIEKLKLTASDEELKEWYNKTPEKYDTYVLKRIFISYEDSDGKLLEGDKLKEKQDLVAEIQEKLSKNEDFGELAGKYTEKSSEKSNQGIYKYKLPEEDSKADVTEINEWMKTAKAGEQTKIEIKKDDKVTGVYFVKYEIKLTFDTETKDYSKDISTMHSTIRSEVINDKYDKKVKDEWVKKDKYKVQFNKDIYENFKVQGMLAK